MDNSSSSPISYRADLQGLRAIAVLIVLLAHFQMAGFSGGFVGVDLFFVLSGFLITGALFHEYRENSGLNIVAFYSRRFKRLLPAMLAMIAATLAAAFILLPMQQAKTQMGSAPFSALWLSNFYLTFSEIGYFNELGVKDLFLHTWSLGVEEQFYLTWPLLMLAFLRANKPSGSESSQGNSRIVLGLGVVLILSFLVSLYWTSHHPLVAFYQMPSRAWQFALGGLLFFATLKLEHRQSSNSSAPAIGYLLLAIGIALIGVSTVLFHEQMLYPGWAAVLPSSGAALVILAGKRIPTSMNVLARAPFKVLGDRSYSLYLWHWPILLLFQAMSGKLSTTDILLAIGLTFCLAEFSYRLIERPFWKGSLSHFQPTRILQVGGFSMLVILLVSFHSTRQAFDDELTAGDPPLIDQWRLDVPPIYTMSCDSWYHNSKIEPCTVGPVDAEKTVILLADSIGAQWFSSIAMTFLPQDWRFVVLTKSSCPIVDEPYFYPRIKKEFEICAEWREKILEALPKWEPDLVVVGTAATYGFTDQEWTAGSKRVWEKVRSSGARVAVLAGTPSIKIDAPSCIIRHVESGNPQHVELCSSDRTDDPAFAVAALLRAATEDMDGVEFLDLNQRICPSKKCKAMTSDGVVVFRDSQHLTDSYVMSLAPEVRALLMKSL